MIEIGFSNKRAGKYNIGIVFLTVLCFFHYTAITASRPYISILASETGAEKFEIGLIASSYSIIQVISAMFLGKLIDRIGARIPVALGSLLLPLSLGGLSVAGNLYSIIVCSLLMGFSHVAVLLGVQYISTGMKAGPEREQTVGIVSFTNSSGGLVGPLIGGFMQSLFGTNRGFLGTAVIGIVCFIAAFFIPNGKNGEAEDNKTGGRKSFIDKEILKTLVVSGTVLFSTEVITTYFPLYGLEAGLSAGMIGIILSVSGLAQVFIRPFLKKIITWFRRDRVLYFCFLLGGISIMGYGLVKELILFILIASFSGIMLGLANPLTLLAVSYAASPDQRSQVLALRIMGNYIGQTISPLFFGLLANAIGFAPVFWISGGIMALNSALVKKTQSITDPVSCGSEEQRTGRP